MALVLRKQVYGNGRVSLLLEGEDGVPYCSVTTNMPSPTPAEMPVFLDSYLHLSENGAITTPDVFDILENPHVLRRVKAPQARSQSFHFHEAELLDLSLIHI